MNEYLAKLEAIIAKNGFAVQGVMDNPPLAYTIGLTDMGLPELVMIGVPTRNNKEHDASPSDLKDIADSIIDNAVIDNPEEFGFELETLPPWAADQIVDKRKGWA